MLYRWKYISQNHRVLIMGHVPVLGYKCCHGFMRILLQPCSILEYRKPNPLLTGLRISNKTHSFAEPEKQYQKSGGRRTSRGTRGQEEHAWSCWGIGWASLPVESSRKPTAWGNMSCTLSWILARAGECRLHPPSMAQWGQLTEVRGREGRSSDGDISEVERPATLMPTVLECNIARCGRGSRKEKQSFRQAGPG
jgi:hypothetical protein